MQESAKGVKTKERPADDTKEMLENLIDKRLEILDDAILDAARLLTEIYAEKRFISYLNEMRSKTALKY